MSDYRVISVHSQLRALALSLQAEGRHLDAWRVERIEIAAHQMWNTPERARLAARDQEIARGNND